jgi:hypothetical protein
MKTVISVAVALILALSVVPAIAGDGFQALSKMSTDEQALLTPLADSELATVEGTYYGYGDTCIGCANVSVVAVEQSNFNLYGKDVFQLNSATVITRQEIN